MTTVPQRNVDQKIDEELDRKYPPSWRPEEKGDAIRGKFLRLDYAERFECPVAVIGTGEGERSVFLFHETLRSKLKRLAPESGEPIGIRYDGQVASTANPGRRYHDYSVAVVREQPKSELSWTDVDGDGDDEPLVPAAETPAFEEGDKSEQKGDEEIPF
jgi:hypothetical protein